MTVWRMNFACRITKATNTHSEYVTLIAFPRQQWLRERATMLRMYVHSQSSFRTKLTTNKLLLILQRLQIILRGILYVS